MSETVLALIVGAISSLCTSSGFWAFWTAYQKRKDAGDKLLMGMAHDRIIHLGMVYIERGYVTEDEFENLVDCLFVPYEKKGGNGAAKRIVEGVKQLEIKRNLKLILNEESKNAQAK